MTATPSTLLGLDLFSLNAQNWSPYDKLDFCARHGLSVVHFSDPRQLGSLDPGDLRRVREHADAHGLKIEAGMLSICPSSTIFDASKGSAEEQIAQMIDVAVILGSAIVRCVLGRFPDRARPGGIAQRIADTLAVIRNVRTRVMDAGLKLAVENHAGDMQARELRMLIEEAGTDCTGVCLDAGNALWAMEDPHLTLDVLAPYVLTSHIRDSFVWRVEEGAAVAWTRMGRGNVRIGDYLRTFAATCPGRPISLEIIVRPDPRVLAFQQRDFWSAYGDVRAWEFLRFAGLLADAPPEWLPEQREMSAASELEHVETSLRWTKDFLASG